MEKTSLHLNNGLFVEGPIKIVVGADRDDVETDIFAGVVIVNTEASHRLATVIESTDDVRAIANALLFAANVMDANNKDTFSKSSMPQGFDTITK